VAKLALTYSCIVVGVDIDIISERLLPPPLDALLQFNSVNL